MVFELDHVVAAGADLRAAAVHMSQRLGFTLSRGPDDGRLRILFDDGWLELVVDPVPQWRWSRFYLRGRDLPGLAAALKARGLEPSAPVPVGEGPGRGPAAYEMEVGYPSPTMPAIVQPAGPARPQEAMEPERARAAVAHANSAVALTGVMLVVPQREPVVEFYERLAGQAAGPVFTEGALGIEAQTLQLGGGRRIVVAAAPFGTGPAARFAAEQKTGVFAVMVRVRSLAAAAEALRGGAVSSFLQDGLLVTSNAMPGYDYGAGAMIFVEGDE